MLKINTIRLVSIVAGAAYTAYQAGEHFQDFNPKPPASAGTVVSSTTSAAGSAVMMNTVTFNVVVVTPPSDRGDTFEIG